MHSCKLKVFALLLESNSDCFFVLLGPESSEYQSVVAFLNSIPQDVLAKASFRSRAYTRAVMHFESFIREKKQNIQDHLSFLQVLRVYRILHEL